MYFPSSLSEEQLHKAQNAYEAGDYQIAENLTKRVLAAKPTHTQGTLLQARLFLLSNREHLAVGSLKNLLRREPNLAAANTLLAEALFRTGEPLTALAYGKRALELNPDDPGLLADFIRILEDNARFEESQAILLQSIRDHAKDPRFCNVLADRFIASGVPYRALPALQAVLDTDPDQAEGWVRFARLHLILGNNSAYLASAEKAVQVNDRSAVAHNFLGSALTDPADEARAAKHFRCAIDLDPSEPTAHSSLGIILQKQGNFEEAKKLLSKSVELSPSHGTAHYMLFRARKLTIDDESLIESLFAMAGDASVNPIDRSYLAFSAAKGWEDIEEFGKSIKAYDLANELAYAFWMGGHPWDEEGHRSFVTKSIERFTADRITDLQSVGSKSEAPVLIVGMPRSGTTLVEQIVTSHPDIAAGSELDFWTKHVNEAIGDFQEPINAKTVNGIADDYLELLTKIGKGAARVTDKMPHNFLVLGLVAAALPKAKFIHVRRSAIDTCLSLYSTAFAPPPPYTMRWEDIASAYEEYRRITDHWHQTLSPSQLLEVDYEELITSPEAVTRRMIEFIGLPWSDACLHHEQNKGEVLTASLWQVRQPIYASSIDRARSFRPWLSDIESLLQRGRGRLI